MPATLSKSIINDPAPAQMETRVTEIFSSIQGEGLLLGTPMTFIRFGGCNLRCDYCDEPDTLALDSGKMMTADAICGYLTSNSKRDPWVSLTGGEPLLRKAFLKSLIHSLKEHGFQIYLETSGIFHEALREIEKEVELISMDFKLPSSLDGQLWWERHEKFLAVAPSKTTVKIVLTNKSRKEEIFSAIKILRRFPQVPLVILQPATPIRDACPPSLEALKELHHLVWKQLRQPVRLIPQHHPIWKLP